jgi:CBS domain-containing protein
MLIRDVMTRNVQAVTADLTIRTAARMMDDLNIGLLPVSDGTKLVGVITDRDITIRATAAGKAPDDCMIGEVMTDEPRWCREDSTVEEAMEQMDRMQIRRLPVVDDDLRILGIVSLGDLATELRRAGPVADTLRQVSEPSEPDRPAESLP